MKLRQRDRRALVLLAVAVAVILVLRFALSEDDGPAVIAPTDSVPSAEKRLAMLKQRAAALPGLQGELGRLAALAAEKEKAIIQADTPPQAQAQVLQIVRRVASAQAPPVELRTVEMGQVRPLGDRYGEVAVPVVFECRIEQLLNLMADLAAQPEILATSEIRIAVADAKTKTLNVRLTVSALSPRRLVPERKGVSSL